MSRIKSSFARVKVPIICDIRWSKSRLLLLYLVIWLDNFPVQILLAAQPTPYRRYTLSVIVIQFAHRTSSWHFRIAYLLKVNLLVILSITL